MVDMNSKVQEDQVPSDRAPHLPWMRYTVDIDSFSGCPVTSLPRLDARKSKQGLYPTLDEEFVEMEPQTHVDILVATPGRLMDHINMTKGFSLEHLQYLVVDETDRMLREAYQSWLPTVIQFTRSTNQDHLWLDTAGKTLIHPFTTIRRSGVERGFKGKCFPRLAKIECIFL
ncbi:hypothetical protein QYE76_063227 [Lolium multiflorum]|uniref:ATP-dependent RNA helicase n=1 Tax=Lolium multiflorum TaxID=4521 RepID=A0AAD8W945_LOLMU|nr:hypothetical protein QYE76_063227 [Lolium multiflorum]